MDTGTRLQDILETVLEPIEECSHDKTLGQVLKIFNQGKPILLHSGAWYLVLPEAAVGYPTSCRVIDLPVSDVPVVAPDRLVREVAATLSQQGRPYGLVVHGQQLVGLVSERLLQEYLNTTVRQQAEEERRHLARELHDEIGQLLTALNLILQRAAGVSAIQTKRMLHDAQAMVTDLLTRVQDLSLDLRPSMLDDLGLLPALKWLLQKSYGHMQVKVTLEQAGLECRFPVDVETAAYRIVQEGLTNIARHAEVREARVRVRTEPGKLSLHIEDRGKGFDVDAALAAGASSGLAGMQERALLAGGTLRLFSQPGVGTVVSAEFPLQGVEVSAEDEKTAIRTEPSEALRSPRSSSRL